MHPAISAFTQQISISNPALNAVELFICNSEHYIEKAHTLCTVLSEDESRRAEQYFAARDELKYKLFRSVLRYLIAEKLSIDPAEIKILTNKFGKPYVDMKDFDFSFHFNLSHSGSLCLYVFGDTQVGIDIEQVRYDMPLMSMARRFFSPKETSMLETLPEIEKTQAFYNCWTRKEACLKGLGLGIGHHLANFSVELRPGRQVRVLDQRGELSQLKNWKLFDLSELVEENNYKSALSFAAGS